MTLKENLNERKLKTTHTKSTHFNKLKYDLIYKSINFKMTPKYSETKPSFLVFCFIFPMIVILGADIPGITGEVIQKGFTQLQKPSCDMVIGRAQDGGYYLIGFNTRAHKYIGIVETIVM